MPLHPTLHIPLLASGETWGKPCLSLVHLAGLAVFLQPRRADSCERAVQGCISLNTDFCSKGTSAARNSCRIQTHWRITSCASVAGSFCESWREPVPIQGAAGTWNLSEQAEKDLWALQGLCRAAGRAASAVSHTCTPLSNSRHYMQMFWSVFGKQLHTGTPFASPLATAPCVTEKYGIFIPFLRLSLCSFTVPWKPNFYSCQQITFRWMGECVVAWISLIFFKDFFFLQSK